MKKTLLIIISIAISCFMTFSYAKGKKDKQKDLPPGLQKKAQKGKELPPGWQKKLKKGEILDQEIIDCSTTITPINNEGIITIKIEDKIVKLVKDTKKIVEILEQK